MRKPRVPQRRAGWKKNKIGPKEKLFLLLCSCHIFDTEVNVFFPHRTLLNKSVPVVLWPRGRFFQLHRRSPSWFLPSWNHLSCSPRDLHLSFFHCVFLDSLFLMPGVLRPLFFRATLSLAKPALCFCFFFLPLSLNILRSFNPPYRYRWESFACRRLVGAGFWRRVVFDAGRFI